MNLQNYYDHLKKEGRVELVKGEIAEAQGKLDKLNSDKKKLAENEQLKNERIKIMRKLATLNRRIKKMTAEGKQGLSNTSINYQHRVIHKALKQAVKWQMVARNIADAVEVPKRTKREMAYLHKEQVHKFIAEIKEAPIFAIIIAAIFTGMRQGEILGMRWQDIDLGAGIVKVRQQLQYTAEHGCFFKTPKQGSIRDIPMPLPLNSALRKVKKEQDTIKAIYADAAKNNKGKNEYKDNDLVFCNQDGSPMDGTAITKQFQTLLLKHGFKKIPFHALRHTFATMARAAGIPMEDIQDLLGHADISTTKSMYTHVEIEPLRKAINKLEIYMGS